MEGYYDGDKDKHGYYRFGNNGYYRFDNKGQIGAAGLLYLVERLGYFTSINTRSDKPDIFRITGTKKKQKSPKSIKKL